MTRRLAWVLVSTSALALIACGSKGGGGDGEDDPDVDDVGVDAGDGSTDPDEEWDPSTITEKIRPDHPRMFLNDDTLEAVVAMAGGPASTHYERLVGAVDGYESSPAPDDYGREAMNTAFVYLVTGEPGYLDRAKALLVASVDHYESQTAAGEAVNWYSTSRIGALTTYDWIHDELTAGEREDILGRLLSHVHDVQPEVNPDLGENTSDHTSGFYGVRNLLWYAGLAGYGDGIDDERAEGFLLDGLEMHVDLREHRSRCAGDDGGSASGAINYAFGAYPWSEFNFLHTWYSATGEDIAGDWAHMALFVPYVLWNWLPDEHEFGFGDAYHRDNVLGFWSGRLHFAQFAHFFDDVEPEMASLAMWMLERVSDEPFASLSVSTWGVHPFLLTRLDDPPEPAAPAGLPYARHYENLGQIFMRSGSGPDDAYALFVAGGFVTMHRHYDENGFTIYHRGSLALDTGTRLGEGSAMTTEHMSEYYARTIAHNAILIYEPGEEIDGHYWGYSWDDNDGGQNGRGAEVVAFESTDHYAYVASDATDCYNDSKAAEVVRQFVFLPPHHFVIFDRVVSTRPDFGKYWLLHTATEPTVVSSDVVRAEQDGGRLYSQTLLPAGAAVGTVGGPGSEFWVFGTNYSFEGYETEMTDLMGRYRIEVTPAAPATGDVFLHLLQVGGLALDAMAAGTLVEDGGRSGVSFEHGGRSYEVLFDRSGAPGGHVTITEGSDVLVDQELTNSVQAQSGYPG